MENTQIVFEALKHNPKLSGKDLFKLGLVGSERTGRRIKHKFMESPTEDQLDSLISLAEDIQSFKDEFDPVFYTGTYNFNTDKPVCVLFPSCAHLGGRYTAYADFKKMFDQVVQSDQIFWASLGDDIEGFLAQFPNKNSMVEQLFQVDMQLEMLTKVLKILSDKKKLLFGIGSQHGGDWFNRNWGINPVKQFYLNNDVKFYDGQAYLKFIVGKQQYNIAVSHSFDGSSQYNPLHAHQRALHFNFPNADCIVAGDKHKFAVSEVPAFGWEVDAGNKESDRVLLIQSGTAKTGPDKYTIKSWSRGRLGWPFVVFFPDEHLIKWSWDIDDVNFWLKRKS